MLLHEMHHWMEQQSLASLSSLDILLGIFTQLGPGDELPAFTLVWLHHLFLSVGCLDMNRCEKTEI
jgi:hypothetical protein